MASVDIKTTNFARVQRILQRVLGAKFNVRNRGVLGAGDKPTFATSTTAPSGTTYSAYPSALSGGTTAADYAPYVALCGGWPVVTSTGLGVYSLTKDLLVSTGLGSANAYQRNVRIQFWIDGDTFVAGIRGDTRAWRVIVDGQYEDMAGHANADTGLKYCTFDFTACTTPRKPRKIELEFPSGNSPLILTQIYVKKADSQPYAPSAEEVGPRFIVSTDSYGTGNNATVNSDSFSRYLGDLLGLDDTWSQGRNGASYMRGINSDAGPSALEAITDITAWNPDFVLFALGYNSMATDSGTCRAGTISAANEATFAVSTISAARAALPRVPMLVTTPWRAGSSSVRNRQAAYETAIFAAVNALGDPLIKTFSSIGMQTGYGKTDTLLADGNSDYYIDTDNTHPPTAGHAYIGRYLSGKVINALQSMLA